MIKRAGFLNIHLAIWLPILLFGLTYLLTGFHYETNDDIIISLLLRGIIIKPPLSDLSLYFHGLSHGLVLLYKLAPQLPWYGMLLYALLYVATILALLFLLRHAPVKSRIGLIWLLVFFLASWVEHVFWFNYMRVPLLLAGTGYLLLLPVSGKKSPWLVVVISSLLFITGLCIRPSAALLGFMVVWPATFLLLPGPVISWLKIRPFSLYVGLSIGFFVWLNSTQSPAEKEYQRLDWLKSTVLDFQIYQAQPKTKADKIVFLAINQWLLADTQVINEAFYGEKGSIGLSYILKKTAPTKVVAIAATLIRDHFLVLSLNAFLLFFIFQNHRLFVGFNRKLILVYQVYFWVLIFAIGIFLKLPPRVITPCLSLYTLVNGALFFRFNNHHENIFKPGKLVGLVLALLLGLQLYKITNRAKWQQQNQQTNEAFISAMGNSFQNQLVVTNVLPDYFRSLSPFRNYYFKAKTIFFLTGWATLDPGFKNYYRKLSGQSDFANTVEVLAKSKNTVWVLSPGFYGFLNQYWKAFHGQELNLELFPHALTGQYPVQTYQLVIFKP